MFFLVVMSFDSMQFTSSQFTSFLGDRIDRSIAIDFILMFLFILGSDVVLLVVVVVANGVRMRT